MTSIATAAPSSVFPTRLRELDSPLRLQYPEKNTEIAVRYLTDIRKELSDTQAAALAFRKQFLSSVQKVGENLTMLRRLYASSREFHADMEEKLGLKRASISNYMDLSARWDEFMGYVTRMGSNQEPVLTLTAAMKVIRVLPDYTPDDATEEELAQQDRETTARASSTDKGTKTTRNFHLKVLPTLEKLTNFSNSSVTHEEKEELKNLRSQMLKIISSIESRDLEAAASIAIEPIPEDTVEGTPEEQQAPAQKISELYPQGKTPEEAQASLNLLNASVAEFGNGAKYSRLMGWGESAVRRHTHRLRKAANPLLVA